MSRVMKDSGVEWIGTIPENWEIVKFKYTYKSTNAGEVIDKSYWNSGNETLYTCKRTQMLSDYPDFPNKKRTTNKDLLLTRNATPYVFIPVENAIYSNVVQRVIMNSRWDRTFVKYALQCGAENYQTYGISIPSYNLDVWNNIYIANISKNHQFKIVETLDSKSEQIGNLISNQEQQIEKLKAYKQSLITEVVTKGLNPNAPMKDSGVEWLGEIPNSWKMCRIKDLFSLRNERNYEALEDVNLISLYTDKGVVQHKDIIETTGNRAVTADGYKKVYKDDIVVNIILCWMGAVGKSNFDGVTSPAYDVYKPNCNVNSDYYHYLFRTKNFNGECYRYGRGIMMMRWRTYSTEFTAINVPCPSNEEQQEIVAYLDDQCSKIDALIEIKQKKIDKLNEYKKSLIYEYVTGKKEVC